MTPHGILQRDRALAAADEALGPVRRLLLVDQGWPATLYVAAGLARQGVHLALATCGHGETPFLRRLVRTTRIPDVSDPSFTEAVVAAARRLDCDAVLPCTDDVALALHATAPSIRLVPDIACWQRSLLADKHALVEFMRAKGVRVLPRARPTDRGELEDSVRRIGMPAVLKAARGVAGHGVRIVHTIAEARDAAETLRARFGEWPAVERFAAGGTFLAGGVFAGGRALALYLGAKVEQHPADTGPSIRLRSSDDAELREQTLRAFAALRWTGFASADFVRDADGQFHFLEVNPRPWGSIAAAEQAGVDLFAPMAAMLRGGEPEAMTRCRAGVESVLFPQCWAAALQQGRPGRWLSPRMLRSLRRAVPWRDPWLALHFARTLGWELRHRATA